MSEGSSTPEVPVETPSRPAEAPSRRSFFERLVAALKLDATVFEEVEDDAEALPQALGVVALAAVAGGLGAASGGFGALLGGLVTAIVGWLVGAAIIWAIGVKALGHSSDYPELLRTLGFASAPQLLLVVGVLPIGFLLGLVGLVVLIMSIMAYVLAVRHALDVETGTAVGICVAALLVHVVLRLVFGVAF